MASWVGLRSAVADDGDNGELGGSAFRCCCRWCQWRVGLVCAPLLLIMVTVASWVGLRSAVADDGDSGESGGSTFRCCAYLSSPSVMW